MQESSRKMAVIGCLILILTVLNYGDHAWSHDRYFDHFDAILQRLYFLPVILGSFWFALKGGLIVFSITAVSLLPYLIMHWEGLSPLDLNRLMLILAYLMVAVVLGKAVLMQRREHKRARESETLAAIGKSMSAIAHEMRTPLIAIGGFTKLVRKKVPDASQEAEKLDIVMIEARRLENLLKGVLDFARPLEVKRATAQIDQVIKECMAVTGQIAEMHGIGLESNLQTNLPPVSIDEMRIKQVLINLITNAIQASPEGENVTVGCSLRGDNLVLEITDCGCGIPEQKREEVFSPFFSTKKEGVGLGLPIVKKIVEAHEGDVRIIDNPQGGLIFRIEIPNCLDQSSSPDAQSSHAAQPETADPYKMKQEGTVSETEKISAVEQYLKKQFESSSIESGYDFGRKAQVFKIKKDGHSSTAVIESEFLEKHSAEAIPGILGTFLLAEHLKECDFPIVVTPNGLTD